MASLNGATVNLDPGQIRNQEISPVPANAISYYKVSPWVEKGTDFGTVIGGTPAAAEKAVYVTKGAGSILGFHCKLNAAGSSTAIVVDVKVNGVSVASATLSIGNTTNVIDGTIASAAFTAGQTISLAISGTFTGAQGPYAWVSLYENNAPTT